MGVLLSAYGKVADTKTIEVYYKFLNDIDKNILEKAFQTAIKTERFFPSIATLRRIALDEIDAVPSESDVIIDMRNAIQDFGIYENPQFKYKITQALAEELGWETICNSPVEKLNETLHFRYKSIAEHYKKTLQKGEAFNVPQIEGLHARQGRIRTSKSISIKQQISEIRAENE